MNLVRTPGATMFTERPIGLSQSRAKPENSFIEILLRMMACGDVDLENENL